MFYVLYLLFVQSHFVIFKMSDDYAIKMKLLLKYIRF